MSHAANNATINFTLLYNQHVLGDTLVALEREQLAIDLARCIRIVLGFISLGVGVLLVVRSPGRVCIIPTPILSVKLMIYAHRCKLLPLNTVSRTTQVTSLASTLN
ncbi:hypothetical protein [Moritella yayanosii]|nr:hypothetical protein [Moritella yayanosii]